MNRKLHAHNEIDTEHHNGRWTASYMHITMVSFPVSRPAYIFFVPLFETPGPTSRAWSVLCVYGCARLHVNLCSSREAVLRRGVPLVLREISDGRREPVMSLVWVAWKQCYQLEGSNIAVVWCNRAVNLQIARNLQANLFLYHYWSMPSYSQLYRELPNVSN
jgi:hypothetical protein